MSRLLVEEAPQFGGGMRTIMVSGFENGDLERLKSLPHSEAREALLDMLDARADGIGTVFQCGYGVYGVWFDNENAFLNVGDSCD